jgi:hypothetical protein
MLYFAAVAGLFASVVLSRSTAADSTLAADYQRISKEFERERQAFFRAQDTAKTPEERDRIKFPDREKYARDMAALAEKNSKDSAAVDAIIWVIENARHDSPSRASALAVLKRYDFDSERLDDVCRVLASEEEKDGEEFLIDMISKSPRPEIKGAAALSLGQSLASNNPQKAEQYLGDVIHKYGTKEQKEAAKAELFEIQNLVIGKVAPEIEGEDVDGRKFKLSDYRGKVVVIDFWGDW